MGKKVLRNWPQDQEFDLKNVQGIVIQRIIEAIQSIRYGTITITVQDSEAIQIDKTEKIRLR